MLPQRPPKVSLANLPTPLRRLHRLSAKYEKNIWLKADDQSGYILSGNKVRKLEYLLADAKNKGATAVITCGGIQSNHCRATAFACAQLSLRCHLILRNDPGFKGRSSVGQGNHFLDQLSGASHEIYEGDDFAKKLPSLFISAETRLAHEDHLVYSIPTGGSNGLGVWGYLSAFEELIEQCQSQSFEPELIVCATGSGGTQAGLTLGQHLCGHEAEVLAFAVCDNAEYFDRKVRRDAYDWALAVGEDDQFASELASSLHVQTNDAYIGPGYAEPYPELYDCIAELARSEGVLLDVTYTGKAFYGLLQELESERLKRFKNIVFVHTGGGFGLFPHAPQFVAD